MQVEQQQQPAKSNETAVDLTQCASCGGQFPTFRAICSECEDAAEVDGFRDGKKAVSSVTSLTAPTPEAALV